MKLHVFNPEHDLALAANLSNFTAPHAGRKLRADLGCLPALWADEDDVVLVENIEQAKKTYARLRARVGGKQCHFVDKNLLSKLDIREVEPWGWDLALRSSLLRYGVNAVPSEENIETIRELSHRRHAMSLLLKLQTIPGTIGTSYLAESVEDVLSYMKDYPRMVVKAPWSSSGRGVRFVGASLNDYQERWISNVIDKQGCVMVEPHYNKVRDFGMEFESDGMGNIKYLGLSLFQTKNGAYTGNIIADESEKRDILSHYISIDLIGSVKLEIENALSEMYKGRYKGPFGVDMMLVATDEKDGFLLHPCVEINLRRTMGHVALSVPLFADGYARVMQIVLADKYRIRVRKA